MKPFRIDYSVVRFIAENMLRNFNERKEKYPDDYVLGNITFDSIAKEIEAALNESLEPDKVWVKVIWTREYFELKMDERPDASVLKEGK